MRLDDQGDRPVSGDHQGALGHSPTSEPSRTTAASAPGPMEVPSPSSALASAPGSILPPLRRLGG